MKSKRSHGFSAREGTVDFPKPFQRNQSGHLSRTKNVNYVPSLLPVSRAQPNYTFASNTLSRSARRPAASCDPGRPNGARTAGGRWIFEMLRKRIMVLCKSSAKVPTPKALPVIATSLTA
jgi:hypothetical protein